MEFNERLQEFREKLKIKKKKDMAKKVGISEQLYYMLESGTREPSNNVIKKLVVMSGLPEEFWIYGITDEKEYLQKREDFKCLKDLVSQLENIGLLNIEGEFTEGVKEVILAAAIADISHLIEKKKQKL